MGTQKWQAQDFKGLTPAIDPRQSTEFYALSGKNYVFDSLGPKSSFGNQLLQPQSLSDVEHMQSVRLRLRGGDKVFYFLPTSIVEWNESSGHFQRIYETRLTSSAPTRWTYGFLNALVYFCHPVTGILVYDPETGVCAPHAGQGVPQEALAITENNGRLCVIDPVFFTWSGPSNGLDFSPSLGGAGFQKISDRVSGFPKMITSYTQGVLIWTSGGVMRSEFSGDEFVYRHRALNTEYRLVNSFCSVKVDDDTVVILDERGLFQTRGEAPTPFTPLFNEFLIEYARERKLAIGTNIRLEWDELQRHMYVLVSESYASPMYETCFVLYPPLDKWGSFNDSCYGIFPVRIDTSTRQGNFYGYADASKKIRYWRDIGARAAEETDSTYNLITLGGAAPAANHPTLDGVILSSSLTLNTVPILPHPRNGFYSFDGYAPMASPRAGLDSSIRFGLLRFTELQESNDQLLEVTQLALGSVMTGPLPGAQEDWNIGGPSEDWNFDSNPVDWGLEPANYIDHETRVIGTLDGRTTYVDEIPSEVLTLPGQRYFSCLVPGLWHIIEVSAVTPGQRFHVQYLELTATYSGKLL